MNSSPEQDSSIECENETGDSRNFRFFISAGVLVLLCLASITWISPRFGPEQAAGDRPIRLVVALYMVATMLALAGFFFAVQLKSRAKSLTFWILLFALAFRLVQVFSVPVLEIDHYRYMWDGIVLNHGISPWRYSPEEALTGTVRSTDPQLQEIRKLAMSSDSVNKIVSRIHFESYTTIYPPVSQAVFAVAMAVVPETASVAVHLFAMKIALLIFECCVVLLLASLLVHLRLHPALLVPYAWNPLVVKEIANSGHLDSIAVCFTVAAVCLLVRRLASGGEDSIKRGRHAWMSGIWPAVLLSMGVGAKIYPVVLAPILAWSIFKLISFRAAIVFCAVFVLLSASLMLPMVLEIRAEHNSDVESTEFLDSSAVPTPPTAGQSKEGLTSFLGQWRMNDLAFSFVLENLRPRNDQESSLTPWYIVTSEGFRSAIRKLARQVGIQERHEFKIARLVTMSLFLGIYLCILIRFGRDCSGSSAKSDEEIGCRLMEYVFLLVALFFFLQPTQNPWYWVWALPFIGFARNWGWLFVSPLLFLYYLRFWYQQIEGYVWFGGTRYSGVDFFDHCFVWFEYLPIPLLLIGFGLLVRKRRSNLPKFSE